MSGQKVSLGTGRASSYTLYRPPDGTSERVWICASALAAKRHPNACYPQPADREDARLVLRTSAGFELGKPYIYTDE